MNQKFRLTQLNPRWDHGASGEKIGITFLCPRCANLGSCEVKATWGSRQLLPGENVENLQAFHFAPVLKGSRPECEGKIQVRDGFAVCN